MSLDAIIGIDTLKQCEITINKDGVDIRKPLDTQTGDAFNHINSITAQEQFELQISPHTTKGHFKDIKNIVSRLNL